MAILPSIKTRSIGLNVSVKDEEILLNSLRKNHRLLKFQILFALINDEINIKRASNELSLLAQATFDISLKIIHAQISTKYKVENLKYSIIAYGRFATSTMTANSDLDLVFIYDDENGDRKSQSKNLCRII